MNMTSEKLMDIIRATGLESVSYDRANLIESDFYGDEVNSYYYSVVHVVDSYNHDENTNRFDMYAIYDKDTLVHFKNGVNAMKYVQDFSKGYPKDTYFITKSELNGILRSEKLEILLD